MTLMTRKELKSQVAKVKRLKAISKNNNNLEQSSTGHKQASIIRAKLNEHYAEITGRKMAAPQKSYVYFLINPSFPEIKIGFTTRSIVSRIAELNASTSLPNKFKLVGYIVSANAFQLEQQIHKHLKKFRTNPKREFFNIDIEQAINTVELAFSVNVKRIV